MISRLHWDIKVNSRKISLCALEGSIKGIKWHYLSEYIKKNLKEFYECTGENKLIGNQNVSIVEQKHL